MTFGSFIPPNPALETAVDPAADLGIVIHGGYRAVQGAAPYRGQNLLFDGLCERVASADIRSEDQCSAKYYLDVVTTLQAQSQHFTRLAEVGVFMGGASVFLAGCSEELGFELDLIDTSDVYLQFAYERVRRTFPEAVGRIRLFHGDLPAYVKAVMKASTDQYLVHHDAAHDFPQVVKDLAALSFVRAKIDALILQDTHLRGSVKYLNFVDMALYAVFGLDMKYSPIGMSYEEGDPRTDPNPWQGNYFMPNAPEGFVVPLGENTFRYPHPLHAEADFLP